MQRVDQRGCPPSRAAEHEREPARRLAVTRVREAGPPLVRLVPLSMRAQPIPVGAGVCGMLRPGAVLVRGRDTDQRGPPLRRGQDLAGRQVHDPVRSPQGARVSVQVRSGALRHAGLPLRADPVPGGPSVTPHRIDPRLQGAAVVPPHLIRVYGGIRDRRVPRVGRARRRPASPYGPWCDEWSRPRLFPAPAGDEAAHRAAPGLVRRPRARSWRGPASMRGARGGRRVGSGARP